MKISYSKQAREAIEEAPAGVRRAFFKQISFLAQNLSHPSLHAKKFDESQDLWQARVNRNWRFYFTIVENTYRIEDVIPHPK